MYRIALCDDNIEYLELLEKRIQEYSIQNHIDAYDLTVVLGNLLDNAMEASVNNKIQIGVRYAKGCMTIKVTNDFTGNLIYDADGKLKTRKKESKQQAIAFVIETD